MTVTIPKTRYRNIVAGIIGMAAVVVVNASLFAWWARIDPVIPDLKVEHSEIINTTDPGNPVLNRPGVFEVVRVIRSSSKVEARVTSYFENAPDPLPGVNGRVVTPDRSRVEVASQRVSLNKGMERRGRLFETPKMLPPGEYVFSSRMEFCNPIRCESLTLPQIPVVLGGAGWTDGIPAR